ncbi:MAG: Fe-S cluster assembly ATPase SufC [Deltaproteobacteria bacterium]|nr:Fe-S cluster assembly ATPase SufC [Deltaproteobacteria bacterium]
MLKITDLYAQVDGYEILKGINLDVKAGEVHAIMGPNGSGKSTLSNVIAGREVFDVTAGNIFFQGEDISKLSVEERAAKGIFLSFQYPVEIPGVKNTVFLRAALNAQRKLQGEEELDTAEFLRLVKEKAKLVGLKPELLSRSVNDGFSGGEKKRNEILQMAVLNPSLAILDETDSGLDIDALKTVAEGVNGLRSSDRAIIVITHYQRLLDYIVPDHVHVLSGGKIIKSGDRSLALELEQKGYGWLTGAAQGEVTLPSV